MLLFHRQLDQLDGAFQVHELVAVQVLAFDAEQNVAVARRSHQHHRGALADAERVLVGDDFDAAAVITQIGGGVPGDPNRRLGDDGI